LQEIATELGVQYVVEGTVQRRANRVRITAQLLAVSPERHLWAETYERDLGDVFALQGELAQAIARRINVRLTPGEQGRLTAQRAVHPDAYEAYLKGRHHWNQRTSEPLRESLKYFQQAIDKEPSYALAHAGLADAYLMLGNYSEMPPAEAFPLAKAAARRALDLDDALGQAYATLSAISADYDWDWKESNRLSQRAIELDPSYATAHQWYGQHLVCQGRFEEGLASVQRARELDPLSPVMNSTLGTVLYLGRRYDEAIEQFRRTLELDQTFVGAHVHLGLAYLHKGLHTEALQEVQRARDLAPSTLEFPSFLAYAHALAGNRPEALKLLQELSGLAERRHVSPLLFAIPHIGLGDNAQALDWLEKAVEERAGFLETAKVDPIFDSLRTNPRFAVLLKRLNLAD
jgi:tetratricopeptide (TPR) repeat protein